MNFSTIHVSYRDGSKPKGIRVVLGFSGGTTREFYTDRNGDVVVEHASTGRADVYVSGNKVGTFHAPGETAVFIR